jgi:hypothetical protein
LVFGGLIYRLELPDRAVQSLKLFFRGHASIYHELKTACKPG